METLVKFTYKGHSDSILLEIPEGSSVEQEMKRRKIKGVIPTRKLVL